MSCSRVRDQLVRAVAPLPPAIVAHLAGCAGCATFADRSRQAREALRQHHLAVQPDPGFAGRVAATVGRRPSDLIGWAALRLLPVALALVVVLVVLDWKIETRAAGDDDAIEVSGDEALWLAQAPGDGQ